MNFVDGNDGGSRVPSPSGPREDLSVAARVSLVALALEFLLFVATLLSNSWLSAEVFTWFCKPGIFLMARLSPSDAGTFNPVMGLASVVCAAALYALAFGSVAFMLLTVRRLWQKRNGRSR